MNIIDINDLSFSFPESPRPALNGINFSVNKGEYIAILGANGSGKSTLARCLNGLILPEPGMVSIKGMDPSLEDERWQIRKILQLVFQTPQDQIVATVVEEDIAFGLENLGMADDEMHRRVGTALRDMDLERERMRHPGFLSSGQQQRLALAAVLAMEPEIIVFDEATSMIDPEGRENILDIMDGLNKRGITILHITHDMDEAARAERLLVLSKGELVFDGKAAALFRMDELDEWSLVRPESIKLAQWAGVEPHLNEKPQVLGKRLLPIRKFAGKIQDEGPAEKLPLTQETASTSIEDKALRIESIDFYYMKGRDSERIALRDISLELEAGQSLAIAGITGSGKSTLLQLMAGIFFPDKGSVLSFGIRTDDRSCDLRALRMNSPLSMQRPERAFFELHAADEVAWGPANQGFKARELVDRVRSAMDAVGLPYEVFRDRLCRTLSGGEKRRLALASILAMDAKALLFDEPTSALDPKSRGELMDLLFTESKKRGQTLIFASHSMGEVSRADRLAIVKDGQLLAFGSPRLLFDGNWNADWGISRPYTAEVFAGIKKENPSLAFFPLDYSEIERLGAV